MQNKVELFDRGPGQKMGYNKLLKNQQLAVINYLRISKWAANYKKIANGLYDVCHRYGG